MMRRPNKRKKKKKLSKGAKTAIIVISIILALILAGVGTVYCLWYFGRSKLADFSNINVDPGDIATAYDNGKTLVYNGKTYVLNENIISAAVLGVDKEALGLDNGIVGTAGQADVIIVVAYDTTTGKTSLISIPRDTVADVNLYDEAGGFAGITKEQICLAYAYGDGKDQSCDNVIKSATRLLFGVPVSKYAAMELEGLGAMNDAVGGINLDSLETFNSFKKGENVTLHGNNALSYVRYRSLERVDADGIRRQRQVQYLKAFAAKALSLIKSDFGSVARLYRTGTKYSVTNVSLDEATYLASTMLGRNIAFDDFRTVPGEYSLKDEHAIYTVDETGLFELILDVYYNERVEE